MPNIRSAKKRVKVSATKTAANKARKSNLKTMIKKADAACATNAADKETAVRVAIKRVDQACAKGTATLSHCLTMSQIQKTRTTFCYLSVRLWGRASVMIKPTSAWCRFRLWTMTFITAVSSYTCLLPLT